MLAAGFDGLVGGAGAPSGFDDLGGPSRFVAAFGFVSSSSEFSNKFLLAAAAGLLEVGGAGILGRVGGGGILALPVALLVSSSELSNRFTFFFVAADGLSALPPRLGKPGGILGREVAFLFFESSSSSSSSYRPFLVVFKAGLVGRIIGTGADLPSSSSSSSPNVIRFLAAVVAVGIAGAFEDEVLPAVDFARGFVEIFGKPAYYGLFDCNGLEGLANGF